VRKGSGMKGALPVIVAGMMFCLAGLGAGIEGMVQTARDADVNVVVQMDRSLSFGRKPPLVDRSQIRIQPGQCLPYEAFAGHDVIAFEQDELLVFVGRAEKVVHGSDRCLVPEE